MTNGKVDCGSDEEHTVKIRHQWWRCPPCGMPYDSMAKAEECFKEHRRKGLLKGTRGIVLNIHTSICPRCHTEAVVQDGYDRRCFACGYYPDVNWQRDNAQRRIAAETKKVRRAFVKAGRPPRGKGIKKV